MVSVIIPVYNVEDYIRQCIESVLNQTYNDLQIILVDDGSTDGSGKICDEYAKKDKRIVIVHKNNQGLGCARNTGLEIAKGNYVFFLDSDDYIPKNAIKNLYEIIKKNSIDLICFDLQSTFDRNEKECVQPEKIEKIVDTKELLSAYLKSEISSTICSRFYDIKLWDKIRFESVRLHEDAFIDHLILSQSKRALITNQKYYFYYQRKDSLIHSKFSNLNFLSIECGKRYVDFCREKFPDLELLAHLQLVERQICTLDKMKNDRVEKNFTKKYKTIIADMKKEIPLLRKIDSNNKKYLLEKSFIYVHPILGKCMVSFLRGIKLPIRGCKKLFRIIVGKK